MKNPLFIKGLAVGIIILFIGVGVYPAIADFPIKTTPKLQNEEIEVPVITDTSDSEEDCGCRSINKIQLVILKRLSNLLDKLSNRLEMVIDIIPDLYKHNQKIEEKFEELSNKISTIQETNKELKLKLSLTENDDNLYICGILFLMLISAGGIAAFFNYLFEQYPILIPFIYPIIILPLASTIVVAWVGLVHYNCFQYDPNDP